ncbi:MAG: PLP-dependent transferase, partial [Cyanobacteriota bacterium]|nr:PLP-dependent transferase [Cyanobacteriota bacterium]
MAPAQSDQQQVAGISTRAIHHGESFAAETGAVMPPIFTSSTFAHGNPQGFDYTRSGNPNFRILESVLAAVESCQFATVFASGVSAITAIASTLQAGDLVLCEENLYGCTVRLFEQVFSR